MRQPLVGQALKSPKPFFSNTTTPASDGLHARSDMTQFEAALRAYVGNPNKAKEYEKLKAAVLAEKEMIKATRTKIRRNIRKHKENPHDLNDANIVADLIIFAYVDNSKGDKLGLRPNKKHTPPFDITQYNGPGEFAIHAGNWINTYIRRGITKNPPIIKKEIDKDGKTTIFKRGKDKVKAGPKTPALKKMPVLRSQHRDTSENESGYAEANVMDTYSNYRSRQESIIQKKMPGIEKDLASYMTSASRLFKKQFHLLVVFAFNESLFDTFSWRLSEAAWHQIAQTAVLHFRRDLKFSSRKFTTRKNKIVEILFEAQEITSENVRDLLLKKLEISDSVRNAVLADPAADKLEKKCQDLLKQHCPELAELEK
jgi:hypothetical protein